MVEGILCHWPVDGVRLGDLFAVTWDDISTGWVKMTPEKTKSYGIHQNIPIIQLSRQSSTECQGVSGRYFTAQKEGSSSGDSLQKSAKLRMCPISLHMESGEPELPCVVNGPRRQGGLSMAADEECHGPLPIPKAGAIACKQESQAAEQMLPRWSWMQRRKERLS